MDVQSARYTFLGLFQEFDVKGKFSNKYKVWEKNNIPSDITGVLLSRLGYSSPCPNDDVGIDRQCEKVLGISHNDCWAIWSEIDRNGSTNQTILKVTKEVFERNKIEEKEHGI